MFRLAGLQRQAGRLQSAERTLRRLLRFKEDRTRTHILLAELLLELRRCDESVKHSLSALRIDRRNVAAYNLLALAHLRRGAFGKAIRAAEGAVEAAPMEPFQRFKLATLYHQKGDLAHAVQQYQRLLDFHPSCEFENETHEALAAIEQYQFQEIMIRCMEDSVFRIKLHRDAERTISEYGYVASDGLMSLIRSVDIDELNDIRPPSKPTRYH
jgi:tetratricopeptide (TPR) repeat protein